MVKLARNAMAMKEYCSMAVDRVLSRACGAAKIRRPWRPNKDVAVRLGLHEEGKAAW